MQEKQKRAQVRLYEKVGEQIGLNFIEKLDYIDAKSMHSQSEYNKVIESTKGKLNLA